MKSNQIELRRQQVKGGRWQPEETLIDVPDVDGWRLVIQRAHRRGAERQPFIRIMKYSNNGRFYFCEGLTLTPTHWVRLKAALTEDGRVANLLDAKIADAEERASKSLARRKYLMYGYWKAIAVHLRKVKRELKG